MAKNPTVNITYQNTRSCNGKLSGAAGSAGPSETWKVCAATTVT